MADQRSHTLRDCESQQPKADTATTRFSKTIEVNLQASQKHDVQQPHTAKQGDGRVSFKETTPVGAQ